ncbi:MAG: Trk system potassium transporter TrkA [Mariniblastus sp.]
MNIVILGAGRVGASIADLLCRLEHSVTVVDIDPKMVARVNEEFDVRAIVGSASQSSVLFQAGISGADICMAVTGRDEVNIVAASMAKTMGARRSIARVYAPVFRDLSTFDYQRHFQIDRMLSLEHLTAMELARGIREPGSVVVEQFARGGLEVQELIVGQQGKITRHQLRDLGLSANVRIGTIQRENRMWIASADDQLQIGDKVTVFSRPEDMKPVKALFKTATSGAKRVVIAGGGETGLHLARTLEREGFTVMIIEQDAERCNLLAKLLESTSVIHAVATDPDNLEEQRVGNSHVFVAATGDDEDNLILGVKANDLGAQSVMCVIGRTDYASVTARLGIDLAVSSRDVMAKQILSYLNEGVVISRAKMPGGLINVIEVDVPAGSPATEATLAELGLPDRCLMVAIIHQDYVRVPGATDRLAANDTAILLVEDDVVDTALTLFSPTK